MLGKIKFKTSFDSLKFFLTLLICLIIIFNSNKAFAKSEPNELKECIVVTHCVRRDWEAEDIDKTFKKALEIIRSTPRTNIVEETDSYIHAEAATKWMHYIDDLEIKALPEKGLIQVRSESRVGIGDNGVNRKRVDDLTKRISISIIN